MDEKKVNIKPPLPKPRWIAEPYGYYPDQPLPDNVKIIDGIPHRYGVPIEDVLAYLSRSKFAYMKT